MGGKPVFLWLTVLGLCCAAVAADGWQRIPFGRKPKPTPPPVVTTSTTLPPSPPQTEEATTVSPSPATEGYRSSSTTTTEAAPPKPRVRVDEYEYYEEAQGSLKLLPAADWRAARNLCLEEDAELASPETDGMLAAMTTAMLSAVHPADQVFTGVNDLYFRGYFSSLRGTPLSSLAARWAPGAARGAPGARCLTMAPDGALRGAQCNDTLPYFCFKKTEPGPENECGTNPGYEYRRETSSCYKPHRSPLNWGEAYATCQREGAQLLVPDSYREARVVRDVLDDDDVHVHVGVTGWGGQWVTVQGEPLTKSVFNELDNALDSKLDSTLEGACLSFLTESMLLSRQDCARELPFVCEKKAYI